MTIPLTGSGSLFVRWGHQLAYVQDLNALRGGTASTRVLSGANAVTRYKTLEVDINNGTAIPAVLDGFAAQVTAWQSAQGGLLASLSGPTGIVSQTLITMANNDTPLASKTLTNALNLLVSQMKTAAASIQQSTVSAGAQTAVGSPVGNPAIVASLLRGDGLTVQTPFPETITWTTTQDAQTGAATARQEQLTATTPAGTATELDYLWPLGSAVSKSINLADPVLNNTSTGGVGAAFNLLNNGGFDSYSGSSANYPDNWVAAAGAAGTDFAKETSTIYGDGGGAALKLVGGTAVNTTLTQQFNTPVSTVNGAGGTPAKLRPSASGTPYCLCGQIKADVVPASGVLTFDLIDGSNTTIQDDQAANNSFAITLHTGTTTSYAPFSAAFRLPANLPTTIKLRLKVTTVIPGGSNIFVDSLALVPMQQLYAGGPFVAAFAGSTKTLLNDSWTVAISNTYGVFAQLLEQTLGLRSLGIQIPSSGSPTISDSLVA